MPALSFSQMRGTAKKRVGCTSRRFVVTVSIDAQNLTDEDTLQTTGDPREVLKYQTFGANYLLNVNYKFY